MQQTGVRFWTRQGGAFFIVGGLSEWEQRLWDTGEIWDELHHVADVGFGFVRVTVPWDVLHPDPQRVRSELIDRLLVLLDACEAARLTLDLTVAGVLGGRLFVPRWVIPTEPNATLVRATIPVISEGWQPPLPLKNMYEDSGMLTAQAWLWGELTRLLAAHPAFGRLDAGMGGLLSALPVRHPELALQWWERVRDTHADTAPSWCYTDSLAYLYQEKAPSLKSWRETVETLDLALSVQGAERDGGIDTRAPAFWMLLARSLAQGAVGCAAIGAATSTASRLNTVLPTLGEGPNAFRLATEEAHAHYFEEVLPTLHQLGVPRICHTVWADATPNLFGMPPYDLYEPIRHAGLLRTDGREKEAARIWRQYHASTAKEALPTDVSLIEVDEEEWRKRRGETGFVRELMSMWRNR